MRIILLGAPGAGKGTQAKKLAEKLKLVHISTGDILRKNAKDKTALGREAQGYMEKGLLVPDELVERMLAARFDQPDTAGGFILDGYPRNLAQAQKLDEMLSSRRMGVDFVFDLRASEEVIIQRLTGRRVCSQCQANYHITNMPPREQGVCDKCGGSLYQRSDDNEETVRKRIEVYRQEVASLIDYYQKKQKLQSISADQDAAVVLDEIVDLVASKK